MSSSSVTTGQLAPPAVSLLIFTQQERIEMSISLQIIWKCVYICATSGWEHGLFHLAIFTTIIYTYYTFMQYEKLIMLIYVHEFVQKCTKFVEAGAAGEVLIQQFLHWTAASAPTAAHFLLLLRSKIQYFIAISTNLIGI